MNDYEINGVPLHPRLARIQAARDKTRKRLGDDGCAHTYTDLFVQINSDGSQSVYTGCGTCEKRLSPGSLPASTPGADHAKVAVDLTTVNPPCVVCGGWGTQLHHWAPRGIFGDEADCWPTSYLCRPCHKLWHDAVCDGRAR